MVLPLGVMKDISLGGPRFEPPSNRCYTDWYIPLCSAQSIEFIASSLLFSYGCVCRSKRNMVSKEKNSRLVYSSIPFVPSMYFLGGRRWSKNCFVPTFRKIEVYLERVVPLEWYELNWSVCMWTENWCSWYFFGLRFIPGESVQLRVWIPPASFCDPALFVWVDFNILLFSARLIKIR